MRSPVEAEIAAMFSGFRTMCQQGEDAEPLVEVTKRVLREFPLWAIAQGCLRMAKGKAGLDRRYAPNDTEVFPVVEEIVRPYRRRLETVKALLAAPVEDTGPEAPKPSREELERKRRRCAPLHW
jgi:hypothetical protein